MMRKRFKKRLLSLVLCGAMIFTLCPQTAIAKTADDSAKSITVSDGYDEEKKATPSEMKEERDTSAPRTKAASAELAAPTGLAWDSSQVGRVTWNAVDGATGYEVQLYYGIPGGKTPMGDPQTVNGGDTTEYTFTISALNTIYYFSVTALNGDTRGPKAESAGKEFNDVNVDTVTVKFNLNGGTPQYEAVEVAVGEKLKNPGTPQKDGYIFEGWLYMPGTMWDFNDPVRANMTLSAMWQPVSLAAPTNVRWDSRGGVGVATWTGSADAISYTLQLYGGGGPGGKYSPIGEPVKVEASHTSCTFPITNLFIAGYTFGIKANGVGDVSSEEVFSDAKSFYQVNVDYVDVKYDANGGMPSPLATVRAAVGYPLPDPPSPTREGYRLVGWNFTPSDRWNFNDPVFSEMTLSAVWEPIAWGPSNAAWDASVTGVATWDGPPDATQYSLQLYATGGPNESIFPIGEPVIVPGSPRSYTFSISNLGRGYRFGVKSIAYDGTTSAEVFSEIAVFDEVNTEYVTVTFNTRGGSPASIADARVRTGSRVSEPANVIRSGYRLTGWHSNPSDLWNFRDPVRTDMTLEASWEPVSTDAADTSLLAVVVDDTSASISGTTLSVRLPRGSEIPEDASAIRIATANAKAVISNLQTENGGKTWTFTVVAEDGVTTADYTMNVTVRSSSGGGGGGGGSSSGGGGGGGSSSKPTASASSSLPSYVIRGNWAQGEGNRWRFAPSDGSICVNQWAAVENPYANLALGQSAFDWFRFDEAGNMVCGWFLDADGNWYYLNPASDGTQGRMMTGWQWIQDADGATRCYYFNPNSDGTRGKMMANTTVDGYTLDAQGHWTVDGVVQTK